MADSETKNQLNIGLRYAGTAAGTLFTVLGAAALITPDQAQQLTTAVHDLNQSILTGYGALVKMWVILGPVGIGILTTLGVRSGAGKALAAKLLGIATGSASPAAAEAQAAIVHATSAIAKDKSIPKSEDAKNALVAATISLDEVQTIITDKKTADAATSESVIAAEAVPQIMDVHAADAAAAAKAKPL